MMNLNYKVKEDVCKRIGLVIDQLNCYMRENQVIHIYGTVQLTDVSKFSSQDVINMKANLCDEEGKLLSIMVDTSKLYLKKTGYDSFEMICGYFPGVDMSKLSYLEIYPSHSIESNLCL